MKDAFPLLDRSKELSSLDQAWSDARENKPVFTFVRGDAGVGKTTLLNTWVERVRPLVHLRVDFAGNLGATTSALIDAFQAVLDKYAEESIRWKDDLLERVGRQGSGIGEVFPSFPGNSWFQPVPQLLDGEQLTRRFLQLLRSLVSVWSRCYGAVLLTAENWHLADITLQKLLLQLSGQEVPLLCVATSRFPLAAHESMKMWQQRTVDLAPFTQDKVQRWLAQVFPSYDADRLGFYGELCDHAGGNPLHLQEILRVIGHAGASEMVRVSLDSWLDRKVEALPSSLRRFLQAGAVLGAAFRTSTALECSGLGQELRGLAEEAVQRRFATEAGGVCFWIHDLVRNAILRSVDTSLHSRLSAMAALHVIRASSQTRERLLMFPTFFRGGRQSLDLTSEERVKTRQLFQASAQLMRTMVNLGGARSTLQLLQSFISEDGTKVPDDVLLLSAEIAFESGEISEAIVSLQKMGKNLLSIQKLKRELILCRCFYVARNFSAIFEQIREFAGLLWPARLVSLLGQPVVGFCLSLFIPVLARRMKGLSPVRVSRRRELTEQLEVGLVFFTFQHFRALSAALGLLFVASSSLRRPSHNIPLAALVIGMFWNLPHWAWRRYLVLAQAAQEKQQTVGNPIWSMRSRFLFSLFCVPSLNGVREMWKSYEELAHTHDYLPDPEVETIVKLDLRLRYFWTNTTFPALYQEFQHHAKIARERGNTGLAMALALLDRISEAAISGNDKPFVLEKRLFHDLRARKESFVESGFRFLQAFMAILSGDSAAALDSVLHAEEIPRDLSYWVPRVFDNYIDCLARLLGRGNHSVTVPYRILRATVRRNRDQFGAYILHVDAERARKAGRRDAALWLYQRARSDFERLDRPLLAALVDWRTGDLLWEVSEREIARAYLQRSILQFAAVGMNSAANAVCSRYGLSPPPAPTMQDSERESYLTVALRLHRLTLLGKLATETAHEIKNLNHSVRMSADILERDFESLGAEDGLRGEIERSLPAVQAIKEAAGKIDAHVNRFRAAGDQRSASERDVIDLGDTIQSTVEMMLPVIRRFTRKFSCDTASRKVLVVGDASQIVQVVMNLILNACESLPDMDRRVVVGWASDSTDGLAGFQVSDQGSGIPPDILPRVVEPFFTTKREIGGTGLGMALCKRIVDEHGGTMRIESRHGFGTTVAVFLPQGT